MNIDEAIARLIAELDHEMVVELIGHFLVDTPAQIAVLRKAADQDDLKVLGRTAHSLAGSSSTFGLQTIWSAARALEEAALAGERAKIPGGINALAEAYARVIPELAI